MNKKFKGFFNWNLRHDGGFTLVELIVVIAILAILAGVAIPAYSGYVTKANKVADQTLISDVANALRLYYYSNPEAATTGGVVKLTVDGQAEPEGFGEAAMQAAFGANWADTLKLKYDQWDGEIAGVLAGYNETVLGNINDSSIMQQYSTQGSAEGLMEAVNTLTQAAANAINNNITNNNGNVAQNLKDILGETAAQDVVNTLGDDLLKNPTVVSNMMVGTMAEVLGSNDNPVLQEIVNEYMTAYIYAQKTGKYEQFNKMTDNLSNITVLTQLTVNGLDTLYDGVDETEGYEEFDAYLGEILNDGTMDKDKQALADMMGAVKEIAGNFQDKNSLKNENLFTSPEVLNQVNSYMDNVKAMGGMDAATLELLRGLDLEEGQVAVMIGTDGSLMFFPGDAQVG